MIILTLNVYLTRSTSHSVSHHDSLSSGFAYYLIKATHLLFDGDIDEHLDKSLLQFEE